MRRYYKYGGQAIMHTKSIVKCPILRLPSFKLSKISVTSRRQKILPWSLLDCPILLYISRSEVNDTHGM